MESSGRHAIEPPDATQPTRGSGPVGVGGVGNDAGGEAVRPGSDRSATSAALGPGPLPAERRARPDFVLSGHKATQPYKTAYSWLILTETRYSLLTYATDQSTVPGSRPDPRTHPGSDVRIRGARRLDVTSGGAGGRTRHPDCPRTGHIIALRREGRPTIIESILQSH